ncbi:Outer membrane cobalamin receptor protein [Bacteroides caccae]|uniref:Outer membrane cobalamin receptor protein n=1 Tax=Bacteroides caccae TaxID=47678 RepID=A0A174V4Z5_9BACE|nr:Outer membrane cobalamin receptor protein [Bacteroides caccae]
MFGQIYFRVLGIGCFLSMALLSSAQSKLDSLHHLNEVVVTARINKEVIPVQSLSGDKLEKLVRGEKRNVSICGRPEND